jgi:hypothetical protein
MKNLSRHRDLLCELETSLLMRGIQMGEMSKLGWLIGLVNGHMDRFLIFSIPTVTFNFQNPTSVIPSYSVTLLIGTFCLEHLNIAQIGCNFSEILVKIRHFYNCFLLISPLFLFGNTT